MLGVAGGDDPSGGACMMGIALDRRSQEPLRHAAGEVEAQPFLEPTLSSSRKMVLKKKLGGILPPHRPVSQFITDFECEIVN